MTWWYKVWITETNHKPLQLRTAWNKAALFSMVFSAMLTDAFANCQDGLHLRYRTDGWIFNLRRLKSVTKWRRPSSETSYLLTTVPSTPTQRRRCSMKQTAYVKAVTSSSSPSATKILLNLCISLYLPLRGRTYRQLILTSPIWVVHLQQRCTLMLNSTKG